MSDRLEQIKANRPVYGLVDLMAGEVAVLVEDQEWLVSEVERLRKALEQIADDSVEGYESPQKRVALEALRDQTQAAPAD